MFDLDASLAGFKIKWVSKAFKNDNEIYTKLLETDIALNAPGPAIKDIEKYTLNQYDLMSKNLHSKFWKEAFEATYTGVRAFLKKYPDRYLTMNMWDNNLIKRNNRKILAPSMEIRENVYLPIHIIDKTSTFPITFLTREQINDKYQVNFNRIFYENLTNTLSEIFQEKQIENNIQEYDMYVPAVVEFLTKQDKGCSFWTRLIKYDKNDTSNIQTRHQKWQDVMNIPNQIIDWINFTN